MLARIATLGLVISCLACANKSAPNDKSADSLMVVLPSAVKASAPATPPAPVVVPQLHRDTAIPAMSLDTMPWADPRGVIDTSANAPDIQCAPSPFTPADTLTVRIAVPHGNWLQVKRPDETVFNLVSPKTDGEPNYSVVPSDTFSTMVTLRFHGDIESRALLPGHETVEPIFSQSGRYTFVVGNDLGGRGRDVRECTLRLVPLSRY